MTKIIKCQQDPDISEEDRFKIGRINEFGDIWRHKLLLLIHNGGTLRGIARQLQCDPNTVKRQANLMGVSFSWRGEQLQKSIKQIIIKKTFPL
ncbi:TnsD family Tn7-like transposition protein [Peribacillus loiseleuriae]|uniref:Transposon Tn7 transposition protein TnsD C-terminal domain-containing protein n=1 Tax=Peribacillus loiseleuriae TaxID=1679170 RepID=A0A0K9GTK5_9BACI|nr:hypothetical protein AC625_10845 [Peribacillus loiseleuriae]